MALTGKLTCTAFIDNRAGTYGTYFKCCTFLCHTVPVITFFLRGILWRSFNIHQQVAVKVPKPLATRIFLWGMAKKKEREDKTASLTRNEIASLNTFKLLHRKNWPISLITWWRCLYVCVYLIFTWGLGQHLSENIW